MKGELLLKILEGLKDNTETTLEELFVIFMSPYGSSPRMIQRRLDAFQKERRLAKRDRNESRSFYNLLYRLRRDELITSKERNS